MVRVHELWWLLVCGEDGVVIVLQMQALLVQMREREGCCSSLLRCCSRGSGRRTVQLMARSWWLRERWRSKLGMECDAVVLRKSSRRRLRDGGGASRWLSALQVKVVGGCHG